MNFILKIKFDVFISNFPPKVNDDFSKFTSFLLIEYKKTLLLTYTKGGEKYKIIKSVHTSLCCVILRWTDIHCNHSCLLPLSFPVEMHLKLTIRRSRPSCSQMRSMMRIICRANMSCLRSSPTWNTHTLSIISATPFQPPGGVMTATVCYCNYHTAKTWFLNDQHLIKVCAVP